MRKGEGKEREKEGNRKVEEKEGGRQVRGENKMKGKEKR